MAGLFIDGCDLYTAARFSQVGYAVAFTVDVLTSGGRFGAGCYRISGAGGPPFYDDSYLQSSVPLAFAGKSIIVQYAFKYSGGFAGRLFASIFDAGGTRIMYIKSSSAGNSFELYDANDTLKATSATNIVRPNTWHYIELKVIIETGTAGTVVFKVDGNGIFNYSGNIDVYSANANVGYIRFHSGCANGYYGYVDDIIMLDINGSAPHNNFLGDMRIHTVTTVGDTADADWLKSTGTDGYAMLDDTIPGDHDSDSTYIYSDTVGDLSLFDFDNLSVLASAYQIVKHQFAARKTTSDARTLRGVIDSNGTVVNDTTRSLTTSYVYYYDILDLDPDGSVPWTESKINALKAGVELIS